MFQVICKGRNLKELKQSMLDHLKELETGIVASNPNLSIHKNLEDEDETEVEEVIRDNSPAAQHFNNVTSINNNVAPSDVDAEGLPWDARIHASSKLKTEKGIWKLKKGVDKSIIPQVKNELRGRVNIAPAQPQTPVQHVTHVQPSTQQYVQHAPIEAPAPQLQAAPQMQQQYTQPAPQVEQPVYQQPAPQMQAQVPAQPQVPQQLTSVGHTFETFSRDFPLILSELITHKKITQEYVEQLKAYFNTKEIWNLNDNQKMELFNGFTQAGLIYRVG